MNILINESYKVAEGIESNLLETFRAFFEAPFLELTPRYAVFDYEDKTNKILIELKSRTNTRDRYPTTVVGLNKIKEGQKKRAEGYAVYIVFNFTDGIYYQKLDDSPLTVKEGGRFDRGRPELSMQVHYNVNQLSRLTVVQTQSDIHTVPEFEQIGLLPEYSRP